VSGEDLAGNPHDRHHSGSMSTTAQLSSFRSRPRFRVVRAYAVTVRVLASYLWLRVWRPLLTPDAYARRLVERHRTNARRVERTILELNGLFIKVGQLISILTNFLPEEFRSGLEGLQDQVPARPLEQITGRIRAEFGKGPEELFAWFDPEPIASASLAQVHEARLHDGRRVAIKVQHADIDRIVRLDLTAIRRILGVVQLFTRIRGLESYHSEVREMILEELDFTKEAEHINLIGGRFTDDPMVGFPVVIPEFSTRRVLTTGLVDGTKVTDVESLETHAIDRTALAQRILTAYCQMIFIDGVYHADPHPGNILVRPNGGIVFLDFGAVGELSPQMKDGIPMFLEGVIRRDNQKITSALRRMGFVARAGNATVSGDVAERVIEYFQRRFLEDLTIESWSLSEVQVDMKTKLEAMADLRKLDISFRDLTSTFEVPKDWVLLERTLLLLLGLCTFLDPALNPMRTIQPYLQEFVLGRDRDWVGLTRSALKEMALSALTIPEGIQRFLTRANRGEVEVRVQGLRESATLLYAAAHQLMYSLLATGSAVIAFLSWERGDRMITIGAGTLTGFFLLCLVGSLISARRWRSSRAP
jgi:predicted unusual protein kinase regulating ubiquinone biosynthesis (AarF/ABC1/UbiB family)